ncbi:putative glutathione S-transferase 8 [Ditylenchus destructor]|nr:putative glutathione S-transferase 8 [Ditylenchus destructor]
MVKYELHYFATRALGEAIRLLFAYTNTPYEDIRFTPEQWPDRKPTYKFGRLPVLKAAYGGFVSANSRPSAARAVALSVPTRGLRPLERWLCQCQLAAFGRSSGGFVSVNSRPSAARMVALSKLDGQELAQSAVILRYLAEKFGLAGKDEWEKAKVHEVADFHKDVYSDMSPYFYNVLYNREGDTVALRKDVFLPNAERLFPQYVRLLKESGSGFLAPSGLTFVDFTVADYFEFWISKLEPEFMKENYPEIVAFVERVYSLPQIQDHMKKRKTLVDYF